MSDAIEALAKVLKEYDQAVEWHSYSPHDVNRETEQHKAAAMLAEAVRPALTAYEAAKGGEGWSVEPVISCPRCGGVGFIAPKGIEQLPELYEVSEEPF